MTTIAIVILAAPASRRLVLDLTNDFGDRRKGIGLPAEAPTRTELELHRPSRPISGMISSGSTRPNLCESALKADNARLLPSKPLVETVRPDGSRLPYGV
ncbi:MAG: hypothetical protein AB7F22_28500 [Reyranella sp.]|uniref:hypothetical protein n=1 Tax=Reyranella sp. TaxID=1929291 RepID=UPI003D0A0F28